MCRELRRARRGGRHARVLSSGRTTGRAEDWPAGYVSGLGRCTTVPRIGERVFRLAVILTAACNRVTGIWGAAVVNKRITWREVAMACCLAAILLAGVFVVPGLLYPPLSRADLRGIASPQVRIELQQAQSGLANSVRSSVLQLIAGLVVVAGAVATWRQVHISREGQITERFTRAVDQLGNSQNVDVRVGGIYALERIARDSETDRNAIQFLLGTFIRNHANWPTDTPNGPPHPTPAVDDRLPQLRVRAPDVQVAISVLGRRPRSPDERILNLPRVDLRGVALNGARLDRAQLSGSNLARAELNSSSLRAADLSSADLREASLEDSRLTAATLTGAYLQGANLRCADFSGADLRGASLAGAITDETVFTGAQADAATTWPSQLDPETRRELRIIETGDGGPAQLRADRE